MRYSLTNVRSLLAINVLLACGPAPHPELHSWELVIHDVGSYSSPRACDLNGDGIKDLVIGAGKVEFQPTDSAAFALDGATGAVLWKVHARDQLFGSPVFLRINADTIPDVVIGGRSAELLAIDGLSGEILWEHFPQGDTVDATLYRLYNFYNPQIISDLDHDGVSDLLVSNGGYVKALPGDPNRPPGKLMVISGADGNLIAEAYMPDHKETYMSCLYLPETGNIVFGSGGERIGGHLYLTSLERLLRGDISDAAVLAASATKGFIAPPVAADINADGVRDIIANAVDGRMLAIDGHLLTPLWEVHLPGTEAYCSLTVGYFDADSVPDFFTNFGIGEFPDLMRSYQLAVSGIDGKQLFLDSLGSFHYGSGVAYDCDHDGFDEVFYHFNYSQGRVRNQLKLLDIRDGTVTDLDSMAVGADLGSTPLLDDLDQDGRLEVVYVHENHPLDFFSATYKTGLVIHVRKTNFLIHQPLRWGSYMGSDFTGIF